MGQDPYAPEVTQESHEPWEVVARSGELAEIGYWADQLEADEISTRVQPDSDFHALDGSWHSTFSLCVGASQSARARQLLRDWAEAEQGDNDPSDSGLGMWQSLAGHRPRTLGQTDDTHASGSPRMMRAFVLAILAGSIGYYAGMGSAGRAPEAAPARPSLWDTVEGSGETFVTAGRDGRPRRRLRFDPHSNSVLLEIQRRPDGRYEVLKRFPGDMR